MLMMYPSAVLIILVSVLHCNLNKNVTASSELCNDISTGSGSATQYPNMHFTLAQEPYFRVANIKRCLFVPSTS